MSTNRALRGVFVNFAPTLWTAERLRGVIQFIRRIDIVRVFFVTQVVGVLKFNHLIPITCNCTDEAAAPLCEFLHHNSPGQKKKAAWHRKRIRQGGRM